ncbi:17208_t:CDS:2 [Acaulospora colombiana]|uniref:17208_t:CDS:1 n=1 Tax=Acaulospora colombiana TaxID=27376 RepID=A0ACA9JZ53_9GLOM|nr:17208_t:CDS:2 [Acaulospora colombiana]
MPKVKTESVSLKMINTRANSYSNNTVSLGGSTRTVPRTQSSSTSNLYALGAEPLFQNTTHESKDRRDNSEILNSILNRPGQDQKLDPQPPVNSQPLIPNPISLLNELHQSLKNTNPPKYNYIYVSSGFICELEVFGKVYKSSIPRARKQDAKEDAALIAVNDIKEQEGFSDILSTDLLQAYEQKIENGINDTNSITRSRAWELDINGRYCFECVIGERTFKSDPEPFTKANDARDHIALKAFTTLYNEYCEIERQQNKNVLEIYGMKRSDVSLSATEDKKCTTANVESIASTSTNSTMVPRPANDADTASLVLPSLDESMPRIKEEPPLTTSSMPSPQIKTEQSLSSQAQLPPSISSPNLKRWKYPTFTLQNCLVGFTGTVCVNNHVFKGNAHVKKSEAKEDVAEVAYKYFMERRE